MKFGVVIFPGSNCDHDMIYVLKDIVDQDVVTLWHKDSDLQNVDAIAIPGGFSYGDYLRSGAIAKHSPIMKKVVDFANGGGIVFGICNGFQILCESGLLPGTLAHNLNQKFVCKNVYIKTENTSTAFTSMLKKDRVYTIPVAHGEGRYFADEETIRQLKRNNQILFKYCDQTGFATESSNPNGSVENIAGVCNEKANVFGMMPHPERASDDELGNTDGIDIFHSILSSFK